MCLARLDQRTEEDFTTISTGDVKTFYAWTKDREHDRLLRVDTSSAAAADRLCPAFSPI